MAPQTHAWRRTQPYAGRTVPFLAAMRPRTIPGAFPPARRVIDAYREQLLAELRAVDEQAAALAGRRQAVVDELHRCRDAYGWQSLGGRRVPLPDEVRAVPTDTRVLAGAELRDAAVAALQVADRPLRLTELYRVLLAWGISVRGRPAQTLSNALRGPVAAGLVERSSRGVYALSRRP